MVKKLNYIILTSERIDDLEVSVNEQINKGFIPLGSPVFFWVGSNKPMMGQAMIDKELIPNSYIMNVNCEKPEDCCDLKKDFEILQEMAGC